MRAEGQRAASPHLILPRQEHCPTSPNSLRVVKLKDMRVPLLSNGKERVDKANEAILLGSTQSEIETKDCDSTS